MGVGNFKFSREESEREKQMEFFKNIEIEVNKIIHSKLPQKPEF